MERDIKYLCLSNQECTYFKLLFLKTSKISVSKMCFSLYMTTSNRHLRYFKNKILNWILFLNKVYLQYSLPSVLKDMKRPQPVPFTV